MSDGAGETEGGAAGLVGESVSDGAGVIVGADVGAEDIVGAAVGLELSAQLLQSSTV